MQRPILPVVTAQAVELILVILALC